MVDRCRSGADVERPGHMFLQQTPQSLLITFLIVSILARGSSSCSHNTSDAANINSCPPSAGRFPPRGADEQPVNLFFIWRNYRQPNVAPQAAATLRTLLLPELQNFIKGHLSSSGSGVGSLHWARLKNPQQMLVDRGNGINNSLHQIFPFLKH